MTTPTRATSAGGAAPAQPLVEIRGVTRRFGSVTALDAVDLDLEDGGFHSLLGPSGCGKTTLLRILAGFEQPDEGDVRLDGASLLRVPAHRRPTNIVFQRYALFAHLSVADNVAFGLTTGGGRRRKARSATTRQAVADALELVGLPAYGERFPSQLSGGQAQRVALARALVRRPRLLLLDEPLSALDQNVRLAMRESLLEIHQSTATTFLLVTHDQEEALSMSTSVALLDAGRVVQVGAPETLYRTPASVFAARFLGAGSMLPARVRSVARGRASVVADADAGAATSWSPVAVDATGAGPALVFLRPEELRLVGEAESRVAGTVRSSVFLGAAYEVRVATALGMLRLRTGHAPAIGERVGVGWDDTAGRCFADGGRVTRP